MLIDVVFEARIWLHEPTGSWHFVTVPAPISNQIRTSATERKAFGIQRVSVRTGTSKWNTSLVWDSKRNAYLLPLKASVRAKEQLRIGDSIEVLLLVELGGEND